MTRGAAAPRIRRTRLLLSRVVALGLSSLVAACSSGPSGPTQRVLPDVSTAPAASATATGSQTPSGLSVSGSPSVSSDPGNVVVVDPGLLSYLPISGNGLQQSVDYDNAAQTAANPALRASASALIIATYTVAVAQGSPAPTDDIAVVSVVRLRDPSFDDNWFRDWRDSYDVAACEPAGGVSGHSQAEIGTHIVFIGSCTGGAFTYHTRVANGAIVVSITAVGPARLGETIMSRLAP